MWETWVQSLGQEGLLEKEMATHSGILAWKIPWIEEPGRLQSMGLRRIRHDWATSLHWELCCCCCCCFIAKSYPTLRPNRIAHQAPLSMAFPGKNTGVGCHFLLQGIFPTEGLNLHLLRWQVDSLPLSHLGRPCKPLKRPKIRLRWGLHNSAKTLNSIVHLTWVNIIALKSC